MGGSQMKIKITDKGKEKSKNKVLGVINEYNQSDHEIEEVSDILNEEEHEDYGTTRINNADEFELDTFTSVTKEIRLLFKVLQAEDGKFIVMPVSNRMNDANILKPYLNDILAGFLPFEEITLESLEKMVKTDREKNDNKAKKEKEEKKYTPQFLKIDKDRYSFYSIELPDGKEMPLVALTSGGVMSEENKAYADFRHFIYYYRTYLVEEEVISLVKEIESRLKDKNDLKLKNFIEQFILYKEQNLPDIEARAELWLKSNKTKKVIETYYNHYKGLI